MIIVRSMCGLTYVTVATLCSSCSLQKYLEWWPAASKEAGRPVLILITGPKILRTVLNAVHLYRHYSLFVHNKFQYTWRGDYCECVQPAQLHVLIWSSSSVPPGTTTMQQSDIYYQLLSQHVSGIIMPLFRRTKTVRYCVWCTALVLLGCGW